MAIRTFFHWLPIGIIILLLVLFFTFNLQNYFTLAMIQSHLQTIVQFSQRHNILTPTLFILIYIIIIVIPTPLPCTANLIGGLIFGVVPATIYSAIGETAGGIILVKAIHTSFGNWLQHSSSTRIHKIMHKLKTNATLYLMSLRLLCFFPASLINIAAGLTNITVKRYAIITFFGSIPGILLFAMIGNSLKKIILSSTPIDLYSVLTVQEIVTLALIIIAILSGYLYQRRQ